MKKFILTIFITLSILNLEAQNTWFKFVPGWQAMKSILVDDTIYSFGTGDFEPYDNFLTVNKVSDEGKVYSSDSLVYKKEFNDSLGFSTYYWSSINPIFLNNKLTIPLNLYFYNSKGIDFDTKLFTFKDWDKLHLDIKQDTNTTTMTANKTLNFKNFGIIQEIVRNSKFDNVVYCQLIDFTAFDYRVVKKQPKGSNSIYGHIPYYENIHADNQNPANLFLQILDRWDFHGDPAQFEAVIQKMDTTGKLIWESRPVGDQDSINTTDFKMVQLPSGNILCSWLDLYYRPWKKPGDPYQYEEINDNATIWFAEIDYKTGKKLWIKNIDQYLKWKMTPTDIYGRKDVTSILWTEAILSDNNSVVWCGYRGRTVKLTNSWKNLPILLKTDFKGNPIWYREYDFYPVDTGDKGFKPYSFLKTLDHGFLLTGEYQNRMGQLSNGEFWQKAALLKLDSNGCFTPGCNATDNIIKIKAPENICQVFPNPANTFLKIEYPKGSSDWAISVADINGKEVFQSQETDNQISISNLPNGTYFIQLTNKKYYHHETHQIIIQH